MIKRVFSSHPKFKEIHFHSGLNLLIAERTESSTDKQTRNSAGKSSLIEIIHFIFGAQYDKLAFYNHDDFREHFFCIELEFEGESLVVSRCGEKRNLIYFDKILKINSEIELECDVTSHQWHGSVEDWKKAAGEYFFSIPVKNNEATHFPSFRSIFSYFVRRETSGGMSEPKKNANGQRQQLYDEQLNLSFMLGLDWTLSSDFQDLKAKEKILETLKKSLKDGFLDNFLEHPETLRSQIAVLEGKVTEERLNLDAFNLLPEYKEYEKELTQIKIDIKNFIDKNTIEIERLKSLKESIREANSPNYESLQQLYQESIQVFPEIVKKRFEEVKLFHDSVIRNRKLYLEDEIERVKSGIEDRNKKLEQLTQRQTIVMDVLETHGALEQYNKIHSNLLENQAELEDLKKKLETLQEIEDAKPRLNIERSKLELKQRQNIAENDERINKAIQRFESISSTLFEEAGFLTVGIKNNGINIDVSKQGDRSKGIKSMQIYCFDMTLISLLRERKENFDLLIHDSHLFDSVDSRQVARALMTGNEFATKYNFQYIVTMNSDQIPCDDLPEDFNINSMIVTPQLTDTDDGGLFGFRF